ncbi:Vesicle-associated protein 2-1 [Linum perenne]
MAITKKPPTPTPKPQLQAIQTIPPSIVTHPRTTRHVSLDDHDDEKTLKGCLNIVMFYNNTSDQGSGWIVAGWMKDSLARAMNEQPLLSGRVVGEKDGVLEIVSNDSGVRLLEATIGVRLEEFLEMEDEVKGEGEAELVFWKEVDDVSPQFSPLLYVQVTNFSCGGYSIGISCSLLLADILITHNFLQKWGEIQRQIIISNSSSVNIPIFYLPNLKPARSFTLEAFDSTATRGQSHTLILKAKQQHQNETSLLVNSCAEKARHVLGSSEVKVSSFRLISSSTEEEEKNVLRVKKWGAIEEEGGELVVENASLDDLGIGEVSFYQGNKPVGLSCWVGWKDDETGLVMTIDDGKKNGDDIIVFVAGLEVMSTTDGGGNPMISVHPDELKFIFEVDKQSFCDLKVVNNTERHVAFKNMQRLKDDRDVAVRQTQQLQQELDLMKRRSYRKNSPGFSVKFALIVALIGIVLGFVMKWSMSSSSSSSSPSPAADLTEVLTPPEV